MFFVFLLFLYENGKNKLEEKEGPDAEQSITGSIFSFSPTDVISETNIFSLVAIKDEEGNFQTYSLTNEISNVIIKKYEEIKEQPVIQGTPTRSPTPAIPLYFSPPLLVGISFAIVFVVGLFYSVCSYRTVEMTVNKGKEGVFNLNELAERAASEQNKLKNSSHSTHSDSEEDNENNNTTTNINKNTTTNRKGKSNHRKEKTKTKPLPTPPTTENISTNDATSRRRRTRTKTKNKEESIQDSESLN